MSATKKVVGVNTHYTKAFKRRAVIVRNAYLKEKIKAASKVAAKDLGITTYATLDDWKREGF